MPVLYDVDKMKEAWEKVYSALAQNMDQCFAQGADAYVAWIVDSPSNPYPAGCKANEQWQAGFDAARNSYELQK